MKNLRTPLLCVCITLCSVNSFAQNPAIPVNEPDYNKPKLFQHLPDNIPVNAADLNSLMNVEVGRAINVTLSDNSAFRFEGQVVSAVSKFSNSIQSVVIRSTNFNGARFTISKISNADGTITYKGRIMSFQHSDLYELQNRDGQLVLVKRNFYDLVNE